MRRSPAFIVALALTPLPALAHHGWGSYESTRPMTIEAPIEEVMLGNPHGMLTVTSDGKRWEVTLAPLSRMQARGATAEVVAKGKQVKAYGYPRRDGSPEMRAEWIEIGGRRFELR
jgi:hypothetical protein